MPSNILSLDRLKNWLPMQKSFQPFFLIATCRSGSNLLLSYLQQHNDVRMLNEVLWPGWSGGPRAMLETPEEAVGHIRRSLACGVEAVRGCKLMLYQLEAASLTVDRLHSEFPGAKYVILYRQNLAEQFVSNLKALATNQFALRPGMEKNDALIHVDPAKLRAFCDTTEQGYRDVLRRPWLRQRGLLLSYEELVSDSNGMLQQICTLLGVKQVPATTKMRKQNDKPLEATISNYAEVAAMLPGCRQIHEWPRHMAA
jgi:LPS sulfotransferase NodH